MKKLLFILTVAMMVSVNANAQIARGFAKAFCSHKIAVAGYATSHAITQMNQTQRLQQHYYARRIPVQTIKPLDIKCGKGLKTKRSYMNIHKNISLKAVSLPLNYNLPAKKRPAHK